MTDTLVPTGVHPSPSGCGSWLVTDNKFECYCKPEAEDVFIQVRAMPDDQWHTVATFHRWHSSLHKEWAVKLAEDVFPNTDDVRVIQGEKVLWQVTEKVTKQERLL